QPRLAGTAPGPTRQPPRPPGLLRERSARPSVRSILHRIPVSHLPISDYGLLSDCRSAALVSRDGSVDWLCFPRFDKPSVFARILDEQAGHWSIYTVGATEVSRRYLEGTMVLETTFHTPTGSAVLVDAMAMGRNERGHELGVASPGIVLRSISCQSGTVEIELEYAPRFEYGLIFPLLRPIEGGILARGGSAGLVRARL